MTALVIALGSAALSMVIGFVIVWISDRRSRRAGPASIERELAEHRIRAELADELHQLRHRRREHQPDSWFWAITHAERVVRGES